MPPSTTIPDQPNEPARLAAELSALSSRLRRFPRAGGAGTNAATGARRRAADDVGVKNYKQVLDARESLSRSALAAGDMEQAATKLSQAQVPALRESISEFAQSGRVLCDAHKQTLSTVELHASLVDLLAIPQLMDTCARSGAVDEALELCSFARTLRARHGAISSSLQERGGGLGGANRGGEGKQQQQHPGTEIVDQVALEVEGARRRGLAGADGTAAAPQRRAWRCASSCCSSCADPWTSPRACGW
jgi:hypothetical protein